MAGNKNYHLVLRVDKNLHDEIMQNVAVRGGSVSGLIRNILAEHFGHIQPENESSNTDQRLEELAKQFETTPSDVLITALNLYKTLHTDKDIPERYKVFF